MANRGPGPGGWPIIDFTDIDDWLSRPLESQTATPGIEATPQTERQPQGVQGPHFLGVGAAYEALNLLKAPFKGIASIAGELQQFRPDLSGTGVTPITQRPVPGAGVVQQGSNVAANALRGAQHRMLQATGAPESLGEKIAFGAGAMAADLPLYLLPGAALRSAGAVRTPATFLGRVAEDFALGAPTTAAMALDPELSSTAAIGEMTGFEPMQRLAETPAGRVAGDLAMDVTGAAVFQGIGSAISRAREIGARVGTQTNPTNPSPASTPPIPPVARGSALPPTPGDMGRVQGPPMSGESPLGLLPENASPASGDVFIAGPQGISAPASYRPPEAPLAPFEQSTPPMRLPTPSMSGEAPAGLLPISTAPAQGVEPFTAGRVGPYSPTSHRREKAVTAPRDPMAPIQYEPPRYPPEMLTGEGTPLEPVGGTNYGGVADTPPPVESVAPRATTEPKQAVVAPTPVERPDAYPNVNRRDPGPIQDMDEADFEQAFNEAWERLDSSLPPTKLRWKRQKDGVHVATDEGGGGWEIFNGGDRSDPDWTVVDPEGVTISSGLETLSEAKEVAVDLAREYRLRTLADAEARQATSQAKPPAPVTAIGPTAGFEREIKSAVSSAEVMEVLSRVVRSRDLTQEQKLALGQLGKQRREQLSAGARPASPDEEIAMLRTGENTVGGGLDPSIFRKLGANMYKGNLAQVAVKEGIQNAIDAVRGSGRGRVVVDMDTNDRSVTIEDTGTGMSPDVAANQFMDVGGSHKLAGASGGYGLAKVGLLAHADHFDMDTVFEEAGKKVRTRISGSAKDWVDGTLHYETQDVTDSPVPTGTRLYIKFAEDVDADFYEAERWAKAFGRYNRTNEKVELRRGGHPIELRRYDEDDLPSFSEPTVQRDVSGARVSLSPSKATKRTANVEFHVLNNGLYQFSISKYLNDYTEVPPEIIVNVEPKVRPDEINYPFTTSREELKGEALDVIDDFTSNISMEVAKRKGHTVRERLKTPARTSKGFGIYAIGERVTPATTEMIAKGDYIDSLTSAHNDVIQEIKAGIRKWRHNGLEDFDFGGIGLSGDFLGVNIYKSALERLSAETGVDVASAAPKNMVLTNPFGTFSEKYPAYMKLIEGGRPKLAAYRLAMDNWGTLIHEVVHQLERNHGEGFAGALTRTVGLTPTKQRRMVDKLYRAWVEALSSRDFISHYLHVENEWSGEHVLKGLGGHQSSEVRPPAGAAGGDAGQPGPGMAPTDRGARPVAGAPDGPGVRGAEKFQRENAAGSELPRGDGPSKRRLGEAGALQGEALLPLGGALGGAAGGAALSDDDSRVEGALALGLVGAGLGAAAGKAIRSGINPPQPIPQGLRRDHARVMGQLDFDGEIAKAEAKKAKGGFVQRLEHALDWLATSEGPIARLDQLPGELPPTRNPRDLLTTWKNWHKHVSNAFYRGVLDPISARQLGPSYRELVEPFAGNEDRIKEAFAYAVNKRLVERAKRGKVDPFAGDAAQRASAERMVQHWEKDPQMKGFEQRLESYIDGLGEYAVRSGLWTRDTWNRLKASDAIYIPIKRIFGPGKYDYVTGIQSRLSNVGTGLKRFQGSRRAMSNPALTLAEYTNAIIRRADTYRVANAIIERVEAAGPAGEMILTKMDRGAGMNQRMRAAVAARQAKGTQAQLPQDVADALSDLLPFDIDRHNPIIWRNDPASGRREYYLVNSPELARAMEGLKATDSELRELADKVLLPMKRVFTATTTALVLPFTLGTNVLRDPVALMAKSQSKAGPLKMVAALAKGYYEAFAGVVNQGPVQRVGGSAGSFSRVMADMGLGHVTLWHDTQHIDPKAIQRQLAPVTKGQKARGVIGEALPKFTGVTFLEAVGSASEMGFRLAEADLSAFSKNAPKVQSGQWTVDDLLLRAATEGREVIDYTNRPASGALREAANYIPFFNPALQATATMTRAAMRNPKRVAAVAAGIALSSIISWALNQRSDKTRIMMADRHPSERASFMFAPLDDDGKWTMRIPLPQELAPIHGAVQAGLDAWMSKDPSAAETFAQSIHHMLPPGVGELVVDQELMVPIPGIRGMLEIAKNKKTFSGAPVEPASMQDMRPEERYTDNTSLTAHALAALARKLPGKGMDSASPMQAQHLMEDLTSRFTPQLTAATDVMVAPFLGREKPPRIPPTMMRSPFNPLSSLMANPNPTSTAPQQRYYDLRDRVQQSRSQMRQAIETQDTALARRTLENERPFLGGEDVALTRSADKQLRDLRGLETKIRSEVRLGRMDPAEARQQLNEIARIKATIFRNAEGILRSSTR